MALLELIDVEGDAQEESESIVETWYCEYSDIAGGYSLSYPVIGSSWEEDDAYKCTALKFNREAKKYYSADASKSSHNGADVCVLQATFTLDWSKDPEGTGEDAFSTRIASAGYRSYKINAGGTWGIIQKPCGYEAGTYELKLPIIQIDRTVTIIQSEPLNDAWYGSMVGKLNSTTFMDRARGLVLFDSFSMVPKFVGDQVETELTLTFKVLSQDWNWEFRNPVQARAGDKLMNWQNKDAGLPNYTTDASKVNMPIWSGEVSGYGDAAYGSGGWDYRLFGVTSTTSGVPFYDYADLNDLFDGEPAEDSSDSE